VLAYVDSIPSEELAITAITAAELLYGVSCPPAGRRRRSLQRALRDTIEQDFADRVLGSDSAAAGHYAQIVADRERAGRPISQSDAQIAAVWAARDATLATRNTWVFEGVGIDILNPSQNGTR
jgi:predicted nucleic acid-binding protein